MRPNISNKRYYEAINCMYKGSSSLDYLRGIKEIKERKKNFSPEIKDR